MHKVFYATDLPGNADMTRVHYVGEYENIDDAIEAKLALRDNPDVRVSWIEDGASIAHQSYHK